MPTGLYSSNSIYFILRTSATQKGNNPSLEDQIKTENITEELCKNQELHFHVYESDVPDYSLSALLDFSSVFDTIDLPILVHPLHTDFGFTDTVLQWFSSYLTNHTHYISLSNHCSAFAPVHSGVPQGSVLGPILLTMYIKPLSAIITHTQSHTIHSLMTYNYRCLLPQIEYQSYFTRYSHV